MIEYHTYTVADVRSWLYDGAKNGLSEQVISKVRANSIIHNPYVEDDMVIVVSATDGNKIVGYTAMFPEHLVRPDVWLSVPTTLYADPDYAGEFIGYNVTKLLHETANGRLVIGSDIAKASALMDKLLGLKMEKVDRKRYVLNRKLQIHSLRNVVSCMIEPYRIYRQHKNINKLSCQITGSIGVEYTDFIDNESYQFIVNHSDNDMFLRSQEMVNWFTHYPFRVTAPMRKLWRKQMAFSSHSSFANHSIAKVYEKQQLIGIYMLANRGRDIHVLMLYADDVYAKNVYAVLLEQVLSSHPCQLWSQYEDLNKYIEKQSISLESYNEQFLFTHPEQLPFNSGMQIQGMDGDMFA